MPRSACAGRGTIFMENQSPASNGAESELQRPAPAGTECLSSNFTLYWRVFVPIFGTVFLSGLLLAFLLIPEEDLYLPYPLFWGQAAIGTIWLGWLLLVRRTIWRLKRVDASPTHFFVTNYWTTVRYPWGDVEKTEEKKRFGRRIVNIVLRAPGHFGQKISFLPGDRFEAWKAENPGKFPEPALKNNRSN